MRLAKYRKRAGYTSANALAKAIDDKRVTKTTIVNLELGKKADMTVTELLLISRALHISPTLLIVDETKPFTTLEGFKETDPEDDHWSSLAVAKSLAEPLEWLDRFYVNLSDPIGKPFKVNTIDAGQVTTDLALASDFFQGLAYYINFREKSHSPIDIVTKKRTTEAERREYADIARSFYQSSMERLHVLQARGIEVPDELLEELKHGASLDN